MTGKVALDSLVRGKAGSTGKAVQGRVYRISAYGWVALLDEDGRQWVAYDGHYEVIGDPRPVPGRTGIPARLQ